MASVTLINFGDGSRVIFSAKKRSRTIPVGKPVLIDVSERTLKKLQQDKTIVVIPEGKDLQQDSPHLSLALETLRDFDNMPYDDLLQNMDKVMGKGAMGPRPLRNEVRMELARRAGIAAHYIQRGALEQAEKSLAGPVSRKIAQAPGPKEGNVQTTKAGMVIKGDDEGEELRGESGESDGEEGEETEAGEITSDEEGGEEGQGSREEGGEEGSEPGEQEAGDGGGRGPSSRVKNRRRRGRQKSE